MDNQVAEQVKTERSRILLELNERKRKEYEDALIGTTQEVLMEEAVTIDGEVYQTGHTKEYVKIGYKTTENLSNQIVDVQTMSHLQILH